MDSSRTDLQMELPKGYYIHNPNPGEFAKIINANFENQNLKIWDTLEENISTLISVLG